VKDFDLVLGCEQERRQAQQKRVNKREEEKEYCRVREEKTDLLGNGINFLTRVRVCFI
jgi:hypothetical protein